MKYGRWIFTFILIAFLVIIGQIYVGANGKENNEIKNIVDDLNSKGSSLIELSDGNILIIWDK